MLMYHCVPRGLHFVFRLSWVSGSHPASTNCWFGYLWRSH